jgi:periplasmic copper chaperone A
MKSLLTFGLVAVLSNPVLADVTISDPWARASLLANRPGAAYLTLRSREHDKLVELTTPVATNVIIHRIENGAGGVGRMKKVDPLELPAGQEVIMETGTMHMMLMGLEAKLVEGTSFPLTLTFETADQVTVEVPVLGVAVTGPEGAGQ